MNTTSPTAAPAPEENAGFDLQLYLRILWTYKWIILGVTVAISALVVFWTLRQPRLYEARCTIEYDPNRASPLGQEVEDIGSPVGSYWATRDFFATQNSIIASRAVSERVVRNLGLHEDPSFFYIDEGDREGWSGESVESAAQTLQSRLSVEPDDDTRIVSIRVVDRSPERAATLANAVAEAYIEKTLEDRMGSTVTALEWLGTQLDTLRGELDASELALHRFKEDHQVLSVSMEDRQNLVASDIEHFNEALTAARTRHIELRARVARITAAAQGDTPEESAAAFPEAETIGTLREELRQKLAERQGLSARYGANHQRMQQLEAEIGDLRRQLQEEIAGVERAAEADVREVQVIERGLRTALDEAQAAGLELNMREIEYQRLNRARANNEKLYNLVLERTTETDLTRMLRTTHVRILDRALEPAGAVSPNVLTNSGAGLGAGLALAFAIAFLLSRLDRRLRSVEEVEGAGLSILGILPRIEDGAAMREPYSKTKRRAQKPDAASLNRDLFVHTHPMSAAAECCRTIRTNLMFMSADAPIRTLVVTSAGPREGKTTVTMNIAISLAQSGKRVLMVDTDLRRPRIHRALGVSGARGVTSVIVGDEKLEDVATATDVPNLFALPCGPIPPNPSELLHSQRFSDLIAKALEQYDRVVFDSPPLVAVTDAAVLAPQVDAVMIVVKAHHTTRDALSSALRQLRDVSANVVGGVLNDLDPRRQGYGNGHYYHYYRREGYYNSETMPDGDGPSPQAPAPPQ
jgi:succinoglycan biosynthesis transport protein ExoP